MNRAALVAFALVAAAVAPTSALANGRHAGGAAHGRVADRGGEHGSRLHTTMPRFFPNHFHHGTRTLIVGTPFYGYPYAYGFGYDAPSYAYAPPVYDDPPVYAPPSPPYIPSASAPPAPPPPPATQKIVEFADGHYELRGDGVTLPYRWVWIPNPPTSPPAGAVAAPPPAPARRTDIYRWTESDGTVHLTDRLEKVPEAYRSKVIKSSS